MRSVQQPDENPTAGTVLGPRLLLLLFASAAASLPPFFAEFGRFSWLYWLIASVWLVIGLLNTQSAWPARHGDAIRALVQGVLWPLYALQRRYGAEDSACYYDVWVNGVKVGQISARDEAKIRTLVLRDPAAYLGQILNLVKIGFRLADTVFLTVPALAFWAAVATAILAPNTYAKILRFVPQAPQVMSTLWQQWPTEMTVLLYPVGIALVLSARFGFENHFARAYAHRIRQHCQVAAEGKVVLRLGDPSSAQPGQ